MLNPFLVSFFSLSSSRSQWTTLCALQAPCWSVSKPACANLLGFWCTPVGIASFTMSTSFLPCWPCSPACLTPKSEHSDTPALCLVSTEVQYSHKNRESIHTQTNFTRKVFFMTLLYFLNWGENLQPNRCWRYQRVSSCFSGRPNKLLHSADICFSCKRSSFVCFRMCSSCIACFCSFLLLSFQTSAHP